MAERPERIGPYAILETLGEGGMGVVYKAEQKVPIHRTVALKVLSAADTSEQNLARFRAERQALAVMDHPGIATIFEIGRSDDGFFWFAMEFVDGEPLGEFCDHKRLTIRERVSLFVEICLAVQHAHQKGLIHRDLKPDNILVAEIDGHHVPKVIDFGISKHLTPEEFEGERLTRDDQIVGTPEYMSPEQIEGSADIDTRSDIYSLGVLLYEILAGALPHDPLAYRGWATLAASIVNDPPPPRKRFDSLQETRASVAVLRSSSVPVVRRELRGDLDFVVSRAMDRDRDQRYQTAHGLAVDLQRFLTHRPVRARGAGAAYVLRKFVRRNRASVAFAVTVVAGIIGFAITTAIQAAQIADARDVAETRRGQAEGLIDFMLSDLRGKLEPVGRLDILDDVGEQAVEYFASLPEEEFSDEELSSRSKALYQIGDVRLRQGDLGQAEPAFRESLRLAQSLSDRDPADNDRLFDLGQSHYYVGYLEFSRGRIAEARRAFEQYRDVSIELVRRDATNLAWQIERSYAHTNLAVILDREGDVSGALAESGASLEAKLAVLAATPDDAARRYDVAQGHFNVAVFEERAGDLASAEAHLLEDQRIKQALFEDDPSNMRYMSRLVVTHERLGRIALALGHADRALSFWTESAEGAAALTLRDPTNTTWRASRAFALAHSGYLSVVTGQTAIGLANLDISVQEYEGLIATDATRSEWVPALAQARRLRADAQLRLGRYQAAIDDTGFAISSMTRFLESHSNDVPAQMELGQSLLIEGNAFAAIGQHAEAARRWARAGDVLAREAGRGNWRFMLPRAEALEALERTDDAATLRRALASMGVVREG